MSDIASKAGVSRSTVSLVLNDKSATVGITENTRSRVLSAARQLGYRPNEVARAMVTGKHRVVVYLVPDPAQEVTTRILAGAMREAESQGYFVKLVTRTNELNERIIEQCVEQRPVGVIGLYIPPPLYDYLQTEMERYQIPVVIVDSSFPHAGMTRVLSDDIEGVFQAISHLYALGHRRIAHIAGGQTSGAAALRKEGYRRAMVHFGLPITERYIVPTKWKIEEMQRAAELLLRLPQPPTALLCVDDRAALIAIRTADHMGLRVPKDLSIVGFADLEMARYANPPLTTVAQPFAELGAAAVQNLLETAQCLERKENIETTEILLPNHLVVRESTAHVPA